MQVSDFNYDLPQELIAQTPMEPRDHSRLLVVDKETGKMEHRHFYDLPNYLRPDDLLVFLMIYWCLTIPELFPRVCMA